MDYVSLLCCFVAFLLYYNTLHAGFVYDDRRAILSNPDLLPEQSWTELFRNDYWGTPLSDSGSHGSYRPLSVLTFRLNYLFDGYQPWGYHLVNIILHCSATVLVIKLAKLILPSSRYAMGPLITGLTFASHPIHTEAVAGVVGRADLAACNFYLLSLLAFVQHIKLRDADCCKIPGPPPKLIAIRPSKITNQVLRTAAKKLNTVAAGAKKNCVCKSMKKWMYLVLCIVLAVCSMLSKETGITVFGVCVLYDIIYAKGLRARQNKTLMLLMGCAVLLLILRLQTNTPTFSTADNPTAKEPRTSTRFFTFAFLPAFNFYLIIFPNVLSFDWGMEAIPRITDIRDPRNLCSFLFYTCLLVTAKKCMKSIKAQCGTKKLSCGHDKNNNNNADHCPVRLMKRVYSAIALSMAFIVLPFLPATNLFVYVGFVVAERVMYIPSVGLCILFGLSGSILWESCIKYRKVFTLCFIGALISFSVKTVLRNGDWFNEEALYRSAVTINPPKAWGNLGSILNSEHRSEEAEVAFRNALRYRPNMADVHYNLGILLQERQRLDEAVQSYQKAIHFRPTLALAYVNMGTALVAAGRCHEAATVFRQAATLDGTGLKDRREHESARISALLQLGAMYSDQGQLHRALATYREAANSLPRYYPPQAVYNVLGETLSKLHQDQEAERWYQAALHAQPNHVAAHLTYGKLLAKNVSRTTEAEHWFRRAQRLAPEDPAVYHHYGKFLAARGRHKEAAVMYEKAADLHPTDYDLVLSAATAMRQADRIDEAETWYRKALALKPSNPSSYANLGAILHLTGKYNEAATSYRRALELQPNDDTTLTNLHKLRSVICTT